MNQPITPILTTHLFPVMRTELLRVLRSLSDDDWQKPTACEGWSVRDVALHILADDISQLSGRRDQDGVYFEVDSWDDLLRLINDHNATWIKAARRISRRLLLSLLEFTGAQFHDYLAGLDLEAAAPPVGWAGNQPAPMWLQIARELTEYWMHHQHICEAVGVESLKERRFLHPVLSTFVHALPYTYRDVDAPPGTVVRLQITGAAADDWFVLREEVGWGLYAATNASPSSTVTLSDDTAWRMFTKGIAPAEVEARATITGDVGLGRVLLGAVAIIA